MPLLPPGTHYCINSQPLDEFLHLASNGSGLHIPDLLLIQGPDDLRAHIRLLWLLPLGSDCAVNPPLNPLSQPTPEGLTLVDSGYRMNQLPGHLDESDRCAMALFWESPRCRAYRVSIESFAQMVKDYIARQPPGFRLNFFVDEVGQFIGQDSKLMLNLQTVAETLGTVCNGRAWVFVTSQADLEGILGSFKGMAAQDITKIMGRFKTQLTLASADVREVIQKRLLAKQEAEPEVLTDIYDREKDNLQTLFRFSDNSINLHGWRGSDEFCGFYPFHTYQFDLFQLAIQQLSKHGVFTGRFLSVGERSMLAVFQEVAKTVRNQDVGRLATFDLMYDGISASIRGDMQTTIKMAERQLGEGIPIRILKSLFLLKWVTGFKATPRNVAILLIDRPEPDIRAHEKAVLKALAELESQSYLQRNGDLFEFLTDTEKDIEVEIKNTDIDESQVADLLATVLFSDVLRDPKIRYEGNGQDYSYARKLDDALIGRDADIALNIITPEHPNHTDATTLAAQNTGKAELLTVLPADTRLTDQARLFLKTKKYVQQNTGGGDDTRKAILDQRSQQNGLRATTMRDMASEFLSKAPLYLNGSRLDSVSAGDARNRFSKACQELISFSFPNLRMLKGAYDETTLSQALLAQDDLLTSGTLTPSESEQEILTYVMRNQNDGTRTSIEEIVRNFGKRPYGWYPMAVLTLVSRLFRMGKVELRAAESPEGVVHAIGQTFHDLTNFKFDRHLRRMITGDRRRDVRRISEHGVFST